MTYDRCEISLCDLGVGEEGTVSKIAVFGGLRRRLLDLGLLTGSCVTCVGRSPFGDPGAYLIRGAVIALRNTDCKNIFVIRT